MRYIQNLIPKQFRVLPDRFKGSSDKSPGKQKPANRILSYIGFVIVAFWALGSLIHPLLFLVLGLFAFILLPYGTRTIEKLLRFQFTSKIKTGTVLLFLFISFPLFYHYIEIDNRENEVARIASEKKKAEDLASEKAEKERSDNFRATYTLLEKSQKDNKNATADSLLEILKSIAKTDEEKSRLNQQENELLKLKAEVLLSKNRFADALPLFEQLIANDPSNVDAQYNRALCLSKTGNIERAVFEVKKAIEMGDERAVKLHDKINPIRRRITGYVTLCCDGSISYSTGRGTCSHHGGVCEWNHPTYEEYRKYE